MAHISNQTIEVLAALPLQDVMERMGYNASKKYTSIWKYRCPLSEHEDKDASFEIELAPANGVKYARFRCHGCEKIQGWGAIELMCQLNGWDKKGPGFPKACHELARLFKLPIDGDNCHGFLHRGKKLATVPDDSSSAIDKSQYPYTSTPCEWTKDHLEALGFKSSHKGCPTGEQIQQDFGIFPISEYRLLSNEKTYWELHDGAAVNSLGQPYNTYPVFEFRYDHHSPFCYPLNEGGWFARKYEPNAAWYGNGRFYWAWEGNNSRTGLLSQTIYGDIDIMNALYDGRVGETINPAWQTTDKRHAPMRLGKLVDVEEATVPDGSPSGNSAKPTKEKELLFPKIIICSGPRDAINVYYHSDAHVVWPHSEATEISPVILQKLKDLTPELYILYDLDKTGQERALRMQLQFPELRNVQLPDDLHTLTSERTKKPCKDAADYFEHYTRTFRAKNLDERFYSIDMDFATLLAKANPIKFWRPEKSTALDEYGNPEEKYEIKAPFMAAFMAAHGYRQYIEPKTGMSRIVHIDNNIVTVLPDVDKEVEREVKNVMTTYLHRHPNLRVNRKQLEHAISVSTVIKREKLHILPYIELEFKGWTDDMDWLFFRNGALCITKDGWKLTPYSQLTFHVNREAIIDYDWNENNTSYFMPVYNAEAVERKMLQIQGLKDALPEKDFIGREQLEREFQEWYNAHAWSIPEITSQSILSMPDYIRFLWHTGFMMWRDVNRDPTKLSREQMQFVNAHLVNKMSGLGYTLAQERGEGKTDISTYQQMVFLIDYGVLDSSKSNGRSGKTATLDSMKCVCKFPPPIDGRHFQTASGDFAKNFGSFKLTVHRFCPIDDLDPSTPMTHLFVATHTLNIKNLYADLRPCEVWESPKLALTMNADIKSDGDSTEGRVHRMYYSDVFNKNYTIKDFLGYNLGSPSHPEELQAQMTFFAMSLQFWHQTHTLIKAPLDERGRRGVVRRAMEDVPFFCDWAEGFFYNADVYNTPVSIRDLEISYYQYVRSRYSREREKQSYVVTSSNIKDGMNRFKESLKKFCSGSQIHINPPECWLKSDLADPRHKRIRFTIWHWDFDKNDNLSRAKGEAEVWYFYREGELPSDTCFPVPRTAGDDLLLPFLDSQN